MTQMVRYGHMLKAKVKRVRIQTRMSWYSEGSVMAGTISSRCTGAESHIEVDSDDDPALVAALIHNARGGCYAEAALKAPVEIRASATLNGSPLDVGAFPSRPPRPRS
jgi:hypothetical protein